MQSTQACGISIIQALDDFDVGTAWVANHPLSFPFHMHEIFFTSYYYSDAICTYANQRIQNFKYCYSAVIFKCVIK